MAFFFLTHGTAAVNQTLGQMLGRAQRTNKVPPPQSSLSREHSGFQELVLKPGQAFQDPLEAFSEVESIYR